ncbi:HNH endonuclease [Natroniella acetigena]|uniref:HNH endonuclease n=1 Tax=Natroniella acetigena TaxID=52004 RepID=UPI00200B8249|nr:HNH endonuclease [Natroniella acetigena]MCK8826395.1 HNH endonuclease [Natroniella acetigena]
MKKKCVVCGAQFEGYHNSKYCSGDCKSKRFGEKECPVCGAVFYPKSKGVKYCSQQCGSEAAAKTMKEKGIYEKKAREQTYLGYTTCNYCGKEFKIKDARHYKYCSIQCANKNKDHKTTSCKYCGEDIKYYFKKPDYCSRKCRRRDNPEECSYCGKEFVSWNGKLYCSEECKKQEYNKRKRESYESVDYKVEQTCVNCGSKYKCMKSVASHRKYCDECQLEVKEERRRDQRRRRRARLNNVKVDKFDSSEIFERDGWVCQLCGKPVDKELKYPHLMSATIDHVTPISKGGSHTKRNVQLAHFICNSIKSDKGTDQLRLFG